ncbi:hypothetical protein ABIA52_002258 [Paenarthrobacter histidinolovorans]|uniref:Cation-transporting P-type ATPase C-terminal domain-containing protein n=1 Tax=Paenarthrobacter histidinolovorans TaxID=43664 RepID=A0ABW8N728_9MICC
MACRHTRLFCSLKPTQPVIQLAGQAAITYVPVMNHLFHTAPLTPEAWIGILGVGLVASVAVAADKHFRRSII